jgi:hypothetical protein
VFNVFGLSMLIVLAGLLGALLTLKVVVEPRQPVAQVTLSDGRIQAITSAEFWERARFERTRSRSVEDDLSFGATVLDQMTREILVRDEAARRGLSVSGEEIDQHIVQVYTADPAGAATVPAMPAPLPSLTPAPRPAKYQTDLKTWARYGLTEAEFRDILRAEILEKKLREAFFQDLPAQQDQVRLRLIRYDLEPDSWLVPDPGWNADAFAALYDRVMAGQVAGANGAILEWSAPDDLERDFNPALREAAFRLPVGGVFPEPISAAGGWYLGQVLSHDLRALPEDWRRQRAESAFEQWLAAQQTRVVRFPRWMTRVPHDLTRP